MSITETVRSADTESYLKPIALPIPQAKIKLANKSRSEIYLLLKQGGERGGLDAIRDGKRTLITVESIERYMASLPRATLAPIKNKSAPGGIHRPKGSKTRRRKSVKA